MPLTSEQVTLAAALLALLASLMAGAISLYNARLQRFTSERWWERKAGAYSDLLEVLIKLRFAAGGLEVAARLDRLVPGTRLERVKEFGELLASLRYTEIRGGFILSEQIIPLIEDMRVKIVQIVEAKDDAKISADAPPIVEETIASVRRIAKRDLGVN